MFPLRSFHTISMFEPILCSKRNLADYKEEHPLGASDALLGAPPEKNPNVEQVAPSEPPGDELDESGATRTPHRVANATSDVPEPHLLDLDVPAHGNENHMLLESPVTA
jgi:hypothetical protein